MSEVYKVPEGIEKSPNGYKPLRDASGRNPLEWAKNFIETQYPAVKNIRIFHEATSDMGWDMKVRFLYNNKTIELDIKYQQLLDTLTNQQYRSLAPHIQWMTDFERGVFNVILGHIHSLEQKWKPLKQKIHTAMEDLSSEIKTA
jgi:hypothetical protein